MYEKTSINDFQYTGWFKLHILLNFIMKLLQTQNQTFLKGYPTSLGS